MTTKAKLREAAKARLAELACTLPDFAERIAGLSAALPISGCAAVAGYWPHRDEADPTALMAALSSSGHPIGLPRIDQPGEPLSFRRWNDGDRVAPNSYGIPEPLEQAAVFEPDVILVPLLAFDAAGHRLGYGGGYYDRTLAHVAGMTIGIAYAGQEVQDVQPQAHDRALDMILTEIGLRKFR